MERILACVDFSAVTARILRRATHLAGQTGAELYVLHVAPAEPARTSTGAQPDAIAGALREARQLADRSNAPNPLRIEALLLRGIPAEVILAQAEALDAALLVLGAHHRGVIHELFVGSVARSVLRQTSRPVLVVPEKRA